LSRCCCKLKDTIEPVGYRTALERTLTKALEDFRQRRLIDARREIAFFIKGGVMSVDARESSSLC
jgi:hypothetical protein